MARFVATQGDLNATVGALADEVNQASSAAYLARSTGTITLTAAQLINGIIVQSGTPGAFNMTLPTAALIVAAIPNAQAGSKFEFMLVNGGDATVTIVTGAGVTLAGTTAVPTSKSQIYRGVVTNATAGSEAVTFLGVLTAPV